MASDPHRAIEGAGRYVGRDFQPPGVPRSRSRSAFVSSPEQTVRVTVIGDADLELGAKLAMLRERGVMILCSGNVVHNVATADPAMEDQGFDWAKRFDEDTKAQLLNAPSDALRLGEHADYAAAAPTPDHFLPLVYFCGLAAEAGGGVDTLSEGFAYGSLSMASYTLGMGGKSPSSTAH